MPRMLGDLTRRRVLLGAGAALCTACASWPQVRDGSTPSRRSVVFMAREFASISGAEVELTIYDDGWVDLWDWDGGEPKPEGRASHRSLQLDAAALEGWSRRLDDPALATLPRDHMGESVMDGVVGSSPTSGSW